MWVYPEKPRPGDRVAVLSPGAALPAVFPGPFELGLARLEEHFELSAVEFPTTRKLGSTPEERAADVHAAFADPEIKAILTSIGGDDQLKVLRHLDADLLRANPKPFFGLSDNTNLQLFLWNLGIVSYSGGTVMTLLGRSGAMNPHSVEALEAALFTHDWYDLRPADTYTDLNRDWKDPANLELEPEMLPGTGWQWYGASHPVEGRLWGGCLEIVDWHLRAGRYLQPNEAYAGSVLFLETSEEMPSDEEVYRILMCMGERGLLQQFAGLLMGRAKARNFAQTSLEKALEYVDAQRAAVLRAFGEYHPDIPLVFDVDFGHTDPQLAIPTGGEVRIDPAAETVSVRY